METWCNIKPYDPECNKPEFSAEIWTLSEETIEQAMYLARHTHASGLPGYKS